MLDPEHRFYNDLPPDEQKHWTSELLKCPAKTQTTPITHAAYLYHPVTYLFCENDQAIPLFIQQSMVKKIEETTGIAIQKETCDAGHSPFLSQPETLLKLVDDIVAKML
jgi:pimeloyl-ACP methyl ester carboxylesterase